MSKRYPSGQANISVDVTIVDDTGLPVTGLVAATFPTVKRSSGSGADATITLSDLTALADAHSDGGVKERGEGVYRLDLPDLADGTHKIRGEATDKRLICEDIQVGVATTLPSIPANWITAAGIAADAITAAKVAADVTTEIQSGLATSSELAKVPKSDGTVAFNATAVNGIQSGLATASALATAQADLDILTGADGVTLATSQPNYAPATAAALDAVDNFIDTEIADIQSRLPAALVGGRMDSSVGAMETGVLTATAIAADAITAAKVASDTLDEIAAYSTAYLLAYNTGSISPSNTLGAAIKYGGIPIGIFEIDGTPTTTEISVVTGQASSLDNYYKDAQVLILSGVGAGQFKPCAAYVGADRTFQFNEPFVLAPAAGQYVLVCGPHTHPTSQIAEAVRDISNASPAAGSLGENIKNALADTNELQTDWADGGRLDLILDARASQTSVDTIDNFLDTEIAATLLAVGTTIPAQIDALLTTALTESYRTDGATGSVAQLLYEIHAEIGEFAITGTTKQQKRLDGTTNAFASTLNDATTPTSVTRSA